MDLSGLPFDDVSKQQLRALAVSPPPGALLVIAGPGDMSVVAARAFAQAMVKPGAEADVVYAVPEGDRWTVAEVDERIVRPSSLVPMERTIVVVEAAEMMDAATAEHLLKTVEEPTARTLFVFAVRSVDLLLHTIRGRASAVVQVHPADSRLRVASLVSAGLSREDATEVIGLAGDLTAFDAAVAADREILPLMRNVFGTHFSGAAPTETAVSVAGALSALAAKVEPDAAAAQSADDDTEGTAKKGSRKVADAVLKARVRTLSRALFNMWRAELSSSLRTGELSASDFADVVAGFEALDVAFDAVGSYVTVTHVLASALSAAPLRVVSAR